MNKIAINSLHEEILFKEDRIKSLEGIKSGHESSICGLNEQLAALKEEVVALMEAINFLKSAQ